MAGTVENFFFAWGAPDDRRDAMVREALCESGAVYSDPRGTVEGTQAITDHVRAFSAAAPNGEAEVIESTEREDGALDLRVRFHGPGFEKFGRYVARLDAHGRIAHLDGRQDG